MINKIVVSVLIGIASFGVSAQEWKIQDTYEVTFSGKKAEGSFRGLTGSIRFDPADLSHAEFDVSVDVSTIETGNNTKNKHARSENWFFVKSHPKIRFTTQTVTKTSNGFLAVGKLDLRGVNRGVSIPFTFSDRGEAGVFSGTLQVDRNDFGIEGNFMEFLVGDDFEVKIVVPVIKSP